MEALACGTYRPVGGAYARTITADQFQSLKSPMHSSWRDELVLQTSKGSLILVKEAYLLHTRKIPAPGGEVGVPDSGPLVRCRPPRLGECIEVETRLDSGEAVRGQVVWTRKRGGTEAQQKRERFAAVMGLGVTGGSMILAGSVAAAMGQPAGRAGNFLAGAFFGGAFGVLPGLLLAGAICGNATEPRDSGP